jgi:tetratricopeptide (TPR) repeat protein
MMPLRSARWTTFATLASMGVALCAPDARAEGAGATPGGEASIHFRRGVELYGEANYTAALVEFRRAYSFAPSAAALYDVGETQFQLQDYAGALRTFRRFMGSYGSDASHYADVQAGVEVLRSRVGVLRVTTAPPGADVSFDDEFVGRSPLDAPVLVSVGHRKVGASMAGRLPVVRYVDVAADDNLSVALELPAATTEPPANTLHSAPETPPPKRPDISSKTARDVGWTVTGVLAAGASVFGGLAIAESESLKNAQDTFPASPGALRHDANLTNAYSVVADSLALGAIAAGALSVYFTVVAARESAPERTARVRLAPTSVSFEATF